MNYLTKLLMLVLPIISLCQNINCDWFDILEEFNDTNERFYTFVRPIIDTNIPIAPKEDSIDDYKLNVFTIHLWDPNMYQYQPYA
jgi:hypothetical protein